VRYLRFHGIELDLDGRTVTRNGRDIDLTVREFDLLAAFLRRPQRVFTREELLDLVWGVDRSIALGTVDTYVSYLRAKVDGPGEPRLVQTVRSVGYALRET
jgi:DNA-binding response OmpR family regulator